MHFNNEKTSFFVFPKIHLEDEECLGQYMNEYCPQNKAIIFENPDEYTYTIHEKKYRNFINLSISSKSFREKYGINAEVYKVNFQISQIFQTEVGKWNTGNKNPLYADIDYKFRIAKNENGDFGLEFYDILPRIYEPILSNAECIVCFDTKQCQQHLFKCTHNNLCVDCFKQMVQKTCPICRATETDKNMRQKRRPARQNI